MACAMHVASLRDCLDSQCSRLPHDTLWSTWGINLSPIPFKRLIPPSIKKNFLWSRLWTNPQGNLKEKFKVNDGQFALGVQLHTLKFSFHHYTGCTAHIWVGRSTITRLNISLKFELRFTLSIHLPVEMYQVHATWGQWRQRIVRILIETIHMLRLTELASKTRETRFDKRFPPRTWRTSM